MGHILIRSRKKGDRLKFKLWQFCDVDIFCKKKKSVFYSNRASLILGDFDSHEEAQPLELRMLGIQQYFL